MTNRERNKQWRDNNKEHKKQYQNLGIACKNCNSSKGKMTLEEYSMAKEE